MTYKATKETTTKGRLSTLLRRAVRAARRRAHRLAFASSGKSTRAVFVVGSGRSGTDLVVACLGHSLDVAIFNEDHPVVFEKWKLRPLGIVRREIEASHAPFALLKPIVETDRVRELLDAFPDSRSVFVVRHYHETIASRVKFFGDGQQEVVARWIETEWQRFPVLPAEIRTVAERAWREAPAIETAAGINWLVVNSAYAYLGLSNEPRVTVLPYSELLENASSVLSRICAFVGLRFEPGMTRAINPAAAVRRAPPALPAELESACAATWEHICNDWRRAR